MKCFCGCEREVPKARRGKTRKWYSERCRQAHRNQARQRGIQAMVKAARRRSAQRRMPVPIPSFAALCRQTMKVRKGWLTEQQAYRAGRTTPEPG